MFQREWYVELASREAVFAGMNKLLTSTGALRLDAVTDAGAEFSSVAPIAANFYVDKNTSTLYQTLKCRVMRSSSFY